MATLNATRNRYDPAAATPAFVATRTLPER